jgi:hypothetical protein
MGAQVIAITALSNGIFTRFRACFPFVLFLFSASVDLTLVLHIAACCNLALQLIASPHTGHKNFQVPSRWGAIH